MGEEVGERVKERSEKRRGDIERKSGGERGKRKKIERRGRR